MFGELNPVGRHFRQNATGAEDDIVGVVADAKYGNLRDAMAPTVYTSIGGWDGEVFFEIRAALDPKALMPEIRAAVSRFDPNLLVTGMKTQMEQIDQNIYQERLVANLSSLFALLALVVACVGIYGLLSYQATRRSREIGIRRFDGRWRRSSAYPLPAKFSVWRKAVRSGDHRGRRVPACGSRNPGQLHSRAPGYENRSHGGVEIRIIRNCAVQDLFQDMEVSVESATFSDGYIWKSSRISSCPAVIIAFDQPVRRP